MYQFRVPDIQCESCIRALTSAVRDLDAHATLRANLETKVVRVETAAANAAIAEAICDAGFTIEPDSD